MTVENTVSYIRYPYSGTGNYSFDFRVFEVSDLLLLYTDTDGNISTLVNDVDYTVTLADVGGICALTLAESDGTLEIKRSMPITQPVNWVNSNRLDMEQLETSQDRITMILQQFEATIEDTLETYSWKGSWATLTNYSLRDILIGPDTNIYIVAEAHTSGTFSADLANGKLALLIDITTLTTIKDAAVVAQVAAELAQSECEDILDEVTDLAGTAVSAEASAQGCADDAAASAAAAAVNVTAEIATHTADTDAHWARLLTGSHFLATTFTAGTYYWTFGFPPDDVPIGGFGGIMFVHENSGRYSQIVFTGVEQYNYLYIRNYILGAWQPWTAIDLSVDDTPVNGATTAPISSNWAYDHVADTNAHNRIVLASTGYTIGSGGDFATINEAFAAMSKLAPTYTGSLTAKVTLQILTGTTINYEIDNLEGVDLSWVRLTSVDATVPVDFSLLPTGVLFTAFRSKLPIIAVLFDMQNLGGFSRGMKLLQGSSCIFESNKGIINPSISSFELYSCSHLACEAGLRATGAASAFSTNEMAISASGASRVDAPTSILSSDGTNAVLSANGSVVNIVGATVSDGLVDVSTGGIICASTSTSTLGRTANTLTSHGVIFK